MTEEVYQSGIYRLGVEVIIRVDQDAGNPDQLLHLSAAVLDFLQQVDLISQLNSVMDENGRALCYVQLIIIEQSRLEDIGDRQWRRVYALTVLGCMPS
jgi:tRNA A58 N-methylase Trm61